MSGSEALRLGAGWTDLSSQGRLIATGEDRERLIHAISSNTVEGLAPGHGAYAFFLNAQGKIQSDSHIFVDRDHVLINCEPEVSRSLEAHIESYIIMDDVVLENVTASTQLLAVSGPRSREVVSTLCGSPPDEALAFVRSGEIRVFRVPVGSTDSYWILAPRPNVQRVIEVIEARGAIAATEQDGEALRVANGVPRFGPGFRTRKHSARDPAAERRFIHEGLLHGAGNCRAGALARPSPAPCSWEWSLRAPARRRT